MSTEKGMKRRTRITLALAALTTAAFGATYGLVAYQGVPQQATTTAAATQSISQSNASAQSSGSGVAPSTSSGSQRAATPPVVHSRTRAS
jgi:hypothetical protein